MTPFICFITFKSVVPFRPVLNINKINFVWLWFLMVRSLVFFRSCLPNSILLFWMQTSIEWTCKLFGSFTVFFLQIYNHETTSIPDDVYSIDNDSYVLRMNSLQSFMTQADTLIELNEMEWKIVFESHENKNQFILSFFRENNIFD